MTIPTKKTILDYFSPKKAQEKIQKDETPILKPTPISEADDKQETPKKLKSSRRLVDISESSSSIENFSDSEVFKKTVGDDSLIGKFENKCNVLRDEKPQKMSKIIADYLDTEVNDFKDCDTVENASDDQRYDFLINIKDANMKSKGEEGYDPSTLYIPAKFYDKFTPFEKQFWDIKRKYYDTVIFFKKGKFYELYEDDAEIASKLFDLRVTARVNMKMAGVPESSYDNWAAKFIAHGFKIGRVDQSENAIGKKIREQDGKKDKIINRELKEIITPGTIYKNEFLQSCFPVYLAALIQHNKCYSTDCTGPCHFSVILYDSSTNQIFVRSFCDSLDCNTLKTIFIQNEIKELITDEKISLKSGTNVMKPIKSAISSHRKFDFLNDEEFECYSYIHNYMKLLCRESSLELATVSGILEESDFIILDGSTITNLDILVNNFDFKDTNTLFKAINYCSTPFGQRLLKRWVVSPLKKLDKIIERRSLAQIFQNCDLTDFKEGMKSLGDLERQMGKLGNGTPSFKDLTVLISSLRKLNNVLCALFEILDEKSIKFANFSKNHSIFISETLKSFDIEYILNENDICPGSSNDELSLLNLNLVEIQSQLESFLKHLKSSTGCSLLCFKSIGKEIFQIEAPLNASLPSNFYLVSSTKSCKRYYSKELKDIIEKYVEVEERIFQSRGSILRRAVEFLNKFSLGITQAVSFVASIDCLTSFAIFNSSHNTSVPNFSDRLQLIDFTNPVYPDYIKNNFCPKNSITLITGPNMGGKSTFLRSICLNIIIAQMGMNTLCESMTLPVFDKIFTRIGASDSLAKGESTFMVEMNEASKILNQSTQNSFVIMDELGRGTSTLDGESIALAVLDQLKEIGCYTLFSTHYHKLGEICEDTDKAYVKCKLEANDITFLYKVEEGVCTDSHGLYVARLAGIPDSIVTEAFKIKKSMS